MSIDDQLKEAMERWRADLSQRRYSIAEQNRLIEKHQARIDALLAEARTKLRARKGQPPESAQDFAAYDAIVARERPLDALKDTAVIKHLHQKIDRLLGGYAGWVIFQNTARDYVDSRAEAMLLRLAGWDAVPLLITGAPAIAVVASSTVVAVRTSRGGLYIHPDRRGKLNHLYYDLHRAETKISYLSATMKASAPKEDKQSLVRYAAELWKLARKASPGELR